MILIKLFVTDVDGVLTDGRILFTQYGEAGKFFHVHDGHGLKQLQQHGIEVAVISARDSAATRARLKELGVSLIFMGVKNKLDVVNSLCNKLNIDLKEVAYIGDDLADLACMQAVGLAIAPNNAVYAIKQCADHTTRLSGGFGAVREACDFLLTQEHHVNA